MFLRWVAKKGENVGTQMWIFWLFLWILHKLCIKLLRETCKYVTRERCSYPRLEKPTYNPIVGPWKPVLWYIYNALIIEKERIDLKFLNPSVTVWISLCFAIYKLTCKLNDKN